MEFKKKKKKRATARGKYASHGTLLLGHQPQTRTSQASCCTVSVLAGGLTYKQLKQMNIFTHWAPVSFTEMDENVAVCIGAFPSLFHHCESSIRCCQQAHTQTINSANTDPLLLFQQQSYEWWCPLNAQL